MADLSVLIPARNEEFLRRTVEDVLEHSEADTEVIVVLDGAWANPPLPVHRNVQVVYHPVSVGQRAATNEAARLSRAKYIMKLDAHCSVAQGFDRILMEHAPYDWTVVPLMYNLLAFHRVCKACGHKNDMGPSVQPCKKCKVQAGFDREMVWKPRMSRKSAFMCFDSELHFQYDGGQTLLPWFKEQKDLTDTMSILGAFWFLHRERYWELGGMDEAHGSWGQMGTEIACKTWLSGGRLVCNHRTWAAHMFRTQGADFGFPYELRGKDVDKARRHSQELWRNNRWPKQIHPLSWLVEKFWPVKGWTKEKLEKSMPKPAVSVPTKGLVYYTDNTLDPTILRACQNRLAECANGSDVVSVSLKPIDFGRNLVLPLERGVLTMFTQILAGLEASTAEIIFLVEHDILYHPSHFDFTPLTRSVFYYNRNTWKVCALSGHALHYLCNQVSGLCAYRELLVEHYRKRVALVEANGWNRNMGYEPGSHKPPRGVDHYRSEWWMSAQPNIDIRHQTNLSRNRWRQDQFRDKSTCLGWTESDRVPGWGVTKGRFAAFLSQWA